MREGANSYIESFYDSYGKSIGRSVGVMTPASVLEYDRDTHVVKVKPLVALEDSDKYVAQGPVTCTVWRQFSGRFLIDVPLEKGDTGWILAADSDTENVKENCVHNDESGDDTTKYAWAPKTSWTHMMQHGIFLPDRWGSYATDSNHVTTATGDDAGRLIIQSEDGKQKIAIGTVGGTFDISIIAGSTVSVNAPYAIVNSEMAKVESQSVDIKAESGVTIDSPNLLVKKGITPGNGQTGTFTGANLVTVTNGLVTGIA